MANFNPNSFEALVLSTMLNRLQMGQPPYLDTTSFISNACDRIIADETKTPLQREEAKLEKKIVEIILSGEGAEKLNPNSGQAVSIGDHQVCVGFHDEEPQAEKGYRIWEWHGHIMLYDEDKGYTAEYIYGNFFEKVKQKEAKEVPPRGTEGLGAALGLGGLVGGDREEANARILCRNMTAGGLR